MRLLDVHPSSRFPGCDRVTGAYHGCRRRLSDHTNIPYNILVSGLFPARHQLHTVDGSAQRDAERLLIPRGSRRPDSRTTETDVRSPSCVLPTTYACQPTDLRFTIAVDSNVAAPPPLLRTPALARAAAARGARRHQTVCNWCRTLQDRRTVFSSTCSRLMSQPPAY